MNLLRKLFDKGYISDDCLSFHYDFCLSDLVKDAKIVNAAKRASGLVTMRFPNVSASYWFPTNSESPYLGIVLKSTDKTSLESAFEAFIQTAGTPSFVYNGNLELAERVLQNYSKDTERKGSGSWVGKYVVNA